MLIVIDRDLESSGTCGASVRRWSLNTEGVFSIRIPTAPKILGRDWLKICPDVHVGCERFGTLMRLLYGDDIMLVIDAAAFREGGGRRVPRPSMNLPTKWGGYLCYDSAEYIQMGVWWMLHCIDEWHMSDAMKVIYYPRSKEPMDYHHEFRFGEGSVYFASRVRSLALEHLHQNHLPESEMAYELRLPFSDRQAVGTQESATGGERDNDCEREDRDELLG